MMDDRSAREFAERYADALNSHDAERIEELVHSDVVWLDPTLPEPARGLEEVKDFLRRSWVAFPDLSFTGGPMWLEPNGESMTWSWRMQGTHQGVIDPPGFASTGKRIDIDGIDVWDFAEGRIERARAYYDTAELARQIGAMPSPGSTGERVGVLLQRTQARFARR